jgi:hypothetical protein
MSSGTIAAQLRNKMPRSQGAQELQGRLELVFKHSLLLIKKNSLILSRSKALAGEETKYSYY